jgi:hypothetical protein
LKSIFFFSVVEHLVEPEKPKMLAADSVVGEDHHFFHCVGVRASGYSHFSDVGNSQVGGLGGSHSLTAVLAVDRALPSRQGC